MRNGHITLVVLCTLLGILATRQAHGASWYGYRPEAAIPNGANLPPRIISLTASASSVDSGDTIAFTATATDPEGSSLTYYWESAGGTFSGISPYSTVSWTAPHVNRNTTYLIKTEVGDGQGNISRKSLAIVVRASAAPVDTEKPVINVVMLAGRQFSTGASVALQWTAGDAGGLASFTVAARNATTLTWGTLATGLSASLTSYTWVAELGYDALQVTAFDMAGNTASADTGYFTVVSSPLDVVPITPLMKPVWPGYTTVYNYLKPRWEGVAGALYYELKIAKNSPANSIGQVMVFDTEYTHANLENDYYYYQVRAVNGAGTSQWSHQEHSLVNANLAPDAAGSPSPSNGAVGIERENVTLAWALNGDPNGDVVSSRVFLGTDPNNLVSQTGFGEAIVYPIGSTLAACKTYYWRVETRDAGQLTAMGPTWSFTTACAAADVAAISVTATGDMLLYNTITIHLTAKNVGGYRSGVMEAQLYISDQPDTFRYYMTGGGLLIPELEPGQQVTLDIAKTIVDYPANNFYIVAHIDPTVTLQEDADPDNNVVSGAFSFLDLGAPTISWGSSWSFDYMRAVAGTVNDVFVNANDDGTVETCLLDYQVYPSGPWVYIGSMMRQYADPSDPNYFTYPWTIPAGIGLEHQKVRLRARCTDSFANEGTGVSALKTIMDQPPTVQLVWPNGGEVLVSGQAYDITWTYEAPNGVGVTWVYAQGCGEGNSVIHYHPGPLSTFRWVIPPAAELTNCKFRVEIQDGYGLWGNDDSDLNNEVRSSFVYTQPWVSHELVAQPFGSEVGSIYQDAVTDAVGNIHVAAVVCDDPGYCSTPKKLYYKRYETVTNTWAEESLLLSISTDGWIRNPKIRLDADGMPHIIYAQQFSSSNQFGAQYRINHRFKTDVSTWSPASQLSTGLVTADFGDFYPAPTFDRNGKLYVFWRRSSEDGGQSGMKYKTWTSAGGWSSLFAVSAVPSGYRSYGQQAFSESGSDDVRVFVRYLVSGGSAGSTLGVVTGNEAASFVTQSVGPTHYPGVDRWQIRQGIGGEYHILSHDMLTGPSGDPGLRYSIFDGSTVEVVFHERPNPQLNGWDPSSILVLPAGVPWVFYSYQAAGGGPLASAAEARAYYGNGEWSQPMANLDPALPAYYGIQTFLIGDRIYALYSGDENSSGAPPRINYADFSGDPYAPRLALETLFPTSLTTQAAWPVSFTATDNVGVTSIKLFWIQSDNVEHLIASFGGATTSYTWGLPGEPHFGVRFAVEAYDAAGNKARAYSAPFDITESVPPTGAFLQPLSGARLYAGAVTTVQWNVSDNDAVTSVALYYRPTPTAPFVLVNTNLLSLTSLNWETPRVESGEVQLKLVVSDRSGNIAEILSYPIELVLDLGVQFTIGGLSPAPNSDNVAPEGTLAWQAINTTGDQPAFDVYFSDTRSLVENLDVGARAMSGGAETYVEFSDLNHITEYFWRVRGSAAGFLHDTGTVAFTTATEYLSAPALSASVLWQTELELAWLDVNLTETGFHVEQSSDGLLFDEIAVLPSGATSFTVAALSADQTYWFRVRAFNAGATSLYSNVLMATTFDNPPSVPSLVSPANAATGVPLAGVVLTWSASDPDPADTLSFRLLFGTSQLPWPYAAGITETEFALSKLEPDTIYNWSVVATDSKGNETQSDVFSFITEPLAIPAAPSDLSAALGSAGEVRLNWVDVADNEASYVIERNDTRVGLWSVVAFLEKNSTSFADSWGIIENETYDYRVRAENSAGASSYSNVTSVTLPNSPPVISPPVAGLDLRWNQTVTVNLEYFKEDQADYGSALTWYAFGSGTVFDAWVTGDTLTVSAIVGTSGVDEFTLWLFDSHAASVSQSVSVTVHPNGLPTASSLALDPVTATTQNDLIATYSFFDPDGESESGTEIRWYRNGVLDSLVNDMTAVSASYTARGDQWYFTVRPSDGFLFGATEYSPTVTIANHRPHLEMAEISPSLLFTNDTATCSHPNGVDADGDIVFYLYRWLKNASPLAAATESTLAGTFFAKGDVLQCEVTPFDGYDAGGTVLSGGVVLSNSQPMASGLGVFPFAATTGNDLAALYTFIDADDDPESGSILRWFKNGIEIAAYAGMAMIPGTETKRGDRWHFTVRPHDGEVFGAPVSSPVREIVNAPPVVVGSIEPSEDVRTTDTLVAILSAVDADGDEPLSIFVEWYVGSLTTPVHAGAFLPATLTTKGQIWHFAARVSDGVSYGPTFTAPAVMVENSPPWVSDVTLSPSPAYADDDINLSYSFIDPDGDFEAGTQVEWRRDGELQPAYTGQLMLPSGATANGQTWTATILPQDGELTGLPVTAAVNITDDIDADGLPDTFEFAHFGNLTTYTGDDDPDGDGRSNYVEYLLGTSPLVNDAPGAPSSHLPEDGSEVQTYSPVLAVNNAYDPPPTDSIVYEYRLYSDANLLSLVHSAAGIPEGLNQTGWSLAPFTLSENTTYWWHARASDGYGFGPWSPAAELFVNVTNEAPTVPQPAWPLNGDSIATLTPVLQALASTDPDFDRIDYSLRLCSSDPCESALYESPLAATTSGIVNFALPMALVENTLYSYSVRAVDEHGLGAMSFSEPVSFFVDVANDPPPAPTIVSPVEMQRIDASVVFLAISPVFDPEGDAVSYDYELRLGPAWDSVQSLLGVVSLAVSFENLIDNSQYQLRVRARDHRGATSIWSTRMFVADAVNEPPTIPRPLDPADGRHLTTPRPEFVCGGSTDVDLEAPAVLARIYRASGGALILESGLLPIVNSAARFTPVADLPDIQEYAWTCEAVDPRGLGSGESARSRFSLRYGNTSPGAPLALAPYGVTNQSRPWFVIENASDPDEDPLRYNFEIYRSADLGDLVSGAAGIAETPETTAWRPADDLTKGIYYWRARGNDGDLYGPWSETRQFEVSPKKASRKSDGGGCNTSSNSNMTFVQMLVLFGLLRWILRWPSASEQNERSH